LTREVVGAQTRFMSTLTGIGGDVERALEDINIPSYAIDSSGVIRWVNPAALRLVGDVRGRQFTSVIAPEETRRAREAFTRKIVGKDKATDADVVLVDSAGERQAVEICSVPLVEGGRVIGVFGQVVHQEGPATPPHPHLTARQAEILRMLEHGRSTQQIAEELHLSRETVRNHVRHVLRALGVHSRLEAVAMARREPLILQ
jgi:PAS domain S-box-containing protein